MQADDFTSVHVERDAAQDLDGTAGLP